MNLSSHATLIDDIYVIGFTGELDMSTLPKLSDLLNKAINDNHVQLALDLDGITVLDDAALGILLGASSRIRINGGRMYVVCSNPKISDYLKRTQLDLIIPLATSVHDIPRN
jgi:anti-sigma B factor antagonist